MRTDPKGYYARLEVAPWAPREAITAAYRRKARVLHPDIPGTGNAAAFVAVKQAYDVLIDPVRRGAYDRSARAETASLPGFDDAEEIFPDPPAPMPSVRMRHPRLADLPLALWVALGGIVLLAAVEATLHLTSIPAASLMSAIPTTAPTVSPGSPPPSQEPVRLGGSPNAYVLPASGAALVWRHDPARDAFVPLGQLPPFSAVQVLHVVRENGLVEIRLNESNAGFIDASRLTPGNAAAAHQAYCAYDAGPAPTNGEMLERHGSGPASVMMANHSGQPAVVKLRDSEGVAAATVFLAPNAEARINGLPLGSYQPEYAIGELWSRACRSFAAGMRSQRFATYTDIAALERINIPPDLSVGALPVDITDEEFEHP